MVKEEAVGGNAQTVFFRVTCAKCGATCASVACSRDEADRLAESAGFKRIYRFNGLEYVRTDLCRDCYGEMLERERDGQSVCVL